MFHNKLPILLCCASLCGPASEPDAGDWVETMSSLGDDLFLDNIEQSECELPANVVNELSAQVKKDFPPQWEWMAEDCRRNFRDWFDIRHPPESQKRIVKNVLGDLDRLGVNTSGMRLEFGLLEQADVQAFDPGLLKLYAKACAQRHHARQVKQVAGIFDLLERTLPFVEKHAPLPAIAAELDALRLRYAGVSNMPPEAVSALADEARMLRRRIIFSHPLLDFDSLLVNIRYPTLYSHMCDQYLGRHSRPAPGLAVIGNWKVAPELSMLLEDVLPTGATMHPCLSYDAKSVVFAFCDHSEPNTSLRRFSLYEAGIDGTGVRRLTGIESDPLDGQWGRATVLIEDFDPCILPDGGVVFVSTRNQGYGRCHGARYTPSYVLHRMEGDGSRIRPISFGEANEWNPRMLHDGRIIYTRWDYINRHDTLFQSLWTTRPDGTGTAHFYGNYTRNPCMTAEARAVPGSHKIVSTAMAHHSYTAGSIILIDQRKGLDGMAPIARLTPEASFPETEGAPSCTFVSPYPLGEDLFLVSFSAEPFVWQGGVMSENAYGVFLCDTLGGRELIYRHDKLSCFDPKPLKPQPPPPVLPSMLPSVADADSPAVGAFFLQNVYAGQYMEGIEPGAIKALRINRLFGQPTPAQWGGDRSRAYNEIVKGIVGIVPVNPDGSAFFRAPADVPLQFQALDENGMAVMTMRSQVYVRPGEQTGCVGCHESRLSAPLRSPVPLRSMKISEPEPPPGPSCRDGLSFVKTVQPVLDRYCIECHGLSDQAPFSLLGTPVKDRVPGYSHGFNTAYMELTSRAGLVSVAQRNQESDFSRPRDYFAHAGRLARILLDGHPDGDGIERVELDEESFARIVSWLDLNAQFYGDWSGHRDENRVPNPEGEKTLRDFIWELFEGEMVVEKPSAELAETLISPPSLGDEKETGELLMEVFGCELADQPFAALVNIAAPEESRILKAPLAESAGGWGRIGNAWTGMDDPGYIRMRELVCAAIAQKTEGDVAGACGLSPCVCGSCWVMGARQLHLGKRGQ